MGVLDWMVVIVAGLMSAGLIVVAVWSYPRAKRAGKLRDWLVFLAMTVLVVGATFVLLNEFLPAY